jgi:hypothetical protein
MSFIISTPTNQKVYNQQFDLNINCVDYLTLITNQQRIISPLDMNALKTQNKSFKTAVIDQLAPGLNLYRAMTFSRPEIELLISNAGVNCEYLRVYCGMDSAHFTQFILPVGKDLNPILTPNIVCISDLPCPPRTGCPNDEIVNS